jgi:hypothetical protein
MSFARLMSTPFAFSFCLAFLNTRGAKPKFHSVERMVAAGHSHAEIFAAYPYLEEEDIRQALAYAAWRVEEIEVPLPGR